MLAGCLHASPLKWPVREDVLNETTQEISSLITRGEMQTADGARLRLTSQLSDYYRQRDYRPVWTTQSGTAVEAAELLNALKNGENEGLSPNDYPIGAIEHYLYDDIEAATQLAKLDLLLTDAFLLYSRNVRSGRLTPYRAGGDWFIPYVRYDGSSKLTEALQNRSMSQVLSTLSPQSKGYRELRHALHTYHAIETRGGWKAISEEGTLELGSSGASVKQLRERLSITGDLPAPTTTNSAGDLFDEQLHEAVVRFQARHGLENDGRVGKQTLEALNVPVEERIRQIEANMERWRWLPELPANYIVVNMAGYDLEVIQGRQRVMAMRVIVGRNYRQTPVFTSEVTTLVLNPSWYVPPTIIRDDILPKLRRDPRRLKKLHLQLLDNGRQLDPAQIDWHSVDGERFPYTLRQEPGPNNPLGRMKFLIPDSDGIYLHDTPDHHLFDKANRALSSGCIRLEHPVELALYLLDDPERWSRESLEK